MKNSCEDLPRPGSTHPSPTFDEGIGEDNQVRHLTMPLATSRRFQAMQAFVTNPRPQVLVPCPVAAYLRVAATSRDMTFRDLAFLRREVAN